MASDLDRDGDPDLVIAHAQGIAWLDNLRQGRFADRTAAAGLGSAGERRLLSIVNLDRLRRVLKVTPVNTVALRRTLAEAATGRGGYILS